MRARRADEVLEQRMAGERLGFQLGMELAAEEPRMVLFELDDLDELAIRRHAGERKPRVPERREVLLVDLVPVAVPFRNQGLAVSPRGKRAGAELAGILSEPHGPAERFDADQVAEL